MSSRSRRAVRETTRRGRGARRSRTVSRGCLPWGTRQLDLRRRGWPPPRMACTTRPGLGTAGTRRIAAAAAAACSAGHRSSSTSNAGDSGWTLSRGSRRPPSDEAPRRPRDGSREGSTPRSCEELDLPGPRLVRRGYPRSRHRRRFRMACRLSPAPAPPPVAANWRSATQKFGLLFRLGCQLRVSIVSAVSCKPPSMNLPRQMGEVGTVSIEFEAQRHH